MFRSTLHLFLYLSRSLKTLANLENILCDSMGENLKFELLHPVHKSYGDFVRHCPESF